MSARSKVLHVSTLFASAVALTVASGAGASNIVYTPVNPQFGGSPLNGSWLFSEGSANNIPQHAANKRSSALATSASGARQTPGQIFAQQLQSQLYSSLANKITSAIFGENAQQNGTFAFEGTTISFNRVGGNIQISINDGQTITNVTVPAGP
jgi:curli production assembly/transport component CsgF